MHFGPSDTKLEIIMDNHQILKTGVTKFLGLQIHDKLSWKTHLEELEKKLRTGIFVLDQLSQSIQRSELKKIYFAFFHSHISYVI